MSGGRRSKSGQLDGGLVGAFVGFAVKSDVARAEWAWLERTWDGDVGGLVGRLVGRAVQ